MKQLSGADIGAMVLMTLVAALVFMLIGAIGGVSRSGDHRSFMTECVKQHSPDDCRIAWSAE